MCLIIFAHQISDQTKLVLAANRDELFTRPSSQAQYWQEEHSRVDILSGRDDMAGGTWIGTTKSQRFAAVTNIRDSLQAENKPKSRGALTLNFLTSDISPSDYCRSIEGELADYAGFNLLVGDGEALWYVNSHEGVSRELEPGVYGLSNDLLNSPWPKIIKGKLLLDNLLSQTGDVSTDALIEMMNQREEADDKDLPNTGVPLDLERRLSPAFISNPEREYGTLCSTALVLSNHGPNRFSEQNYDSAGHATERHYFEF